MSSTKKSPPTQNSNENNQKKKRKHSKKSFNLNIAESYLIDEEGNKEIREKKCKNFTQSYNSYIEDIPYLIHHSKDIIKTVRQTSIANIENVKKGLEEKINNFPKEFFRKYTVNGVVNNPTVVFHFLDDFKDQITIIPYVSYLFDKNKTINIDVKSETTLVDEYARVVWNEINVCLPKDPSFEIPIILLNFLKKHLQVDDVPLNYLQVVPNGKLNIELPYNRLKFWNTSEKDLVYVDDVKLETLTVNKCLGFLKRDICSITMKSSCQQNLKYITIVKKALDPYLFDNVIKMVLNNL